MIIHLETENNSKVLTESGQVNGTASCAISSITLDGGTAATGATVILDNSTDGSGTAKWVLRAPQYGSVSISFVKPIVFSTACYATLTGTSSKLAIAYI
jgi:hypothetical protein